MVNLIDAGRFSIKSIRCEAAGFAVNGWTGCGFDMVYHTVSSFLSSENQWMS